MAQKKTTYIDPIAYKLYIGVESDLESLPEMRAAVLQLSESFYPYAEIASGVYGADAARDFFDRVDTLFSGQAPDVSFRAYWTSRQERFMAQEYAEFCYMPTKIKVPRRSRQRPAVDMLPECRQICDYALSDVADNSLPQAALESLVSCPSDDLRGIYVPRKTTYISNTLMLLYNRLDLMTPENGKKYLHRLAIQIPRYITDAADSGFTLQEQWTDAAKNVCRVYEHAIASVCMDAMSFRGIPRFPTGEMVISCPRHLDSANWDSNEMDAMDGYAWGMCITRKHLERLGGWERLQRNSDVFFAMEQLDNGGAYLQLTPDVSIVTKEQNQRMVEAIFPALCYGALDISAYDVPSYRLHIPAGQLHEAASWYCSMTIHEPQEAIKQSAP